MANRVKLDLRPRYIKELMKHTTFMGYKVTESGVVFNKYGKQIKPKFYFKGKRIDYVYIDVTYLGKKQRISYHRFIYMAWNPDQDLTGMVVAPIKRRFDYSIKNLECITILEHTQRLAKQNQTYADDEIKMIRDTYEEIKDDMSKTEYAKRLNISTRTLSKYLKGNDDGF